MRLTRENFPRGVPVARLQRSPSPTPRAFHTLCRLPADVPILVAAVELVPVRTNIGITLPELEGSTVGRPESVRDGRAEIASLESVERRCRGATCAHEKQVRTKEHDVSRSKALRECTTAEEAPSPPPAPRQGFSNTANLG